MKTTRLLQGLRSTRVQAVLSLGLVAALASGGTLAYWSDTATISGSTLTSGTLDLKVNNNLDNDSNWTSLNITNMVPGNSVAGTVVIRNAGTVPFTYTIGSAGTNADSKNLVGGLVAKVSSGSVTGTSPSATCSGTALTGSGTTFTGALVASRTLAAGASETLCIQAQLPTNAASSLQNATTSLTFTVNAAQIP